MKKFCFVFIAIALLSIVAFSAVFVTGNSSAYAQELIEHNPYPSSSKLSPSFGEYDKVVYKEGYTAKEITDSMSPLEVYNAINDNFYNTQYMAQLATTISNIDITTTTPTFGVVRAGTQLGVVQVSSLITANDAYGNNYYQAISQMETLGEDLDFLDKLAPKFGFWEKRKYVADEKTTYIQSGIGGTKRYDDKYVGGITCNWINRVKEVKDGEADHDSSVFDLKTRIFENIETEDYKVVVGPQPYDNSSNTDELGNLVIKVNFKTKSGGWSYDYLYIWDDVENTAEGKYVYFVGDRNNKALPVRGDAISSYIINEDTFDTQQSKLTKSNIDGHTLYTLDIALKEQGPYTWDLITSGEKKYLQDGTKGFVDFPMEYATIRSDVILKFEVWDNGSIRRIIRQYTMDIGSSEGNAKGADKTSIMGGSGYGYGVVTNTQYQEFAYDGAPVDFLGDSYTIGDGVTDPMIIFAIVGSIVLVLIIVLIVVLVVLKKKGIICKNKKHKSKKENIDCACDENKISTQEDKGKEDLKEDKKPIEESPSEDKIK